MVIVCWRDNPLGVYICFREKGEAGPGSRTSRGEKTGNIWGKGHVQCASYDL